MRALLTRLWAARRGVLIYGLLLAGGWGLSQLLRDVTLPDIQAMRAPGMQRFVVATYGVYILATAIPFVPGAEIGFALLLIFGAAAAPLVYGAMVLSLVLAYGCAALVPAPRIIAALAWLGLHRAAVFVRRLAEASGADREIMLTAILPATLGRRLVRNRYLLLAIALNTPGNSLVGGGGGLAFLAGKSGVFNFWPFLATVAVAAAPVPLLFWLAGNHP